MNNKKVISIVKGVVGTGVAIGAYKLFKWASGKEPEKYSDAWFENASDKLLDMEREKVRKQFCAAGDFLWL